MGGLRVVQLCRECCLKGFPLLVVENLKSFSELLCMQEALFLLRSHCKQFFDRYWTCWWHSKRTCDSIITEFLGPITLPRNTTSGQLKVKDTLERR